MGSSCTVVEKNIAQVTHTYYCHTLMSDQLFCDHAHLLTLDLEEDRKVQNKEVKNVAIRKEEEERKQRRFEKRECLIFCFLGFK